MTSDRNTPCLWNDLQSPCKDVRDAAWNSLWIANKTAMYTLSVRLMQNDATAQDAVQEAMCRFARSIRRIKPRSLPRAYLLRIVHNVCIEWLRKEQSIRRIESQNPPEDRPVPLASPRPEDIAMANERRQQVRRAIDSLPALGREAIVLKFIKQLSNAECAEIMKLRKNTFEVRLHRALRALSRDLIAEKV